MHKKKYDWNKLYANSDQQIDYVRPSKLSSIIDKNNQTMNKLNNNLSDKQGLRNAYNSDNKIFIDGNKMYIAGTSNLQDVWDDLKIPFHLTRYSQRYKDADEELKKNNQVDTIIGHSLGGVVSLELNKNYNNRFKTTTYSAPVFDLFKNRTVNDNNLRFKTNNDIIGLFDKNAINVGKNSVNPLSLHSYDNYVDTGKVGGGVNYQII